MAEKLSLNDLDDSSKEFIQSSLTINDDECFEISSSDKLYLPLAFARSNFELTKRLSTATESIQFAATLRDEQISVYEYSIDKLLNEDDGYCIISAKPGFGKTITAIAIACKLNVKTVIVVKKLILINQWIESVNKFVGERRIQYVLPSTRLLDPSVSFYIVNAINVVKKSRKFWKCIKFLIVDELHQIVTPVLSKSLLRFVPDYLLGLSATPYRFDEYDKAVNWFFGEKNKIGKRLNVKHSVKIIKTGWTPKVIKYTRKGIDWNNILLEQCSNEKRNLLIVNSILSYPNRTWLILVKRVNHALELLNLFFENNKSIKCSTLIRTDVTFDKNCNVLIGTTSKIGVGFDHAEIDALCIAADVKNYFVQFLGRCMRKPDVQPLVIDFEDDYHLLRKHLDERKKDYSKYGGIFLEN